MVLFYRDSRLFLSQHGRLYAVSFETPSWDTQTLNWSRNVSKCYAWQVVSSLMNEQQSQNLLPKQTRCLLLATSWSRKVKKLELGISQVESVCIEYVVAAFKAEIYEIRVCFSHFAACRIAQHIHFFFVVHVEWTACVQRNLKVCINKEPLLWSL